MITENYLFIELQSWLKTGATLSNSWAGRNQKIRMQNNSNNNKFWVCWHIFAHIFSDPYVLVGKCDASRPSFVGNRRKKPSKSIYVEKFGCRLNLWAVDQCKLDY